MLNIGGILLSANNGIGLIVDISSFGIIHDTNVIFRYFQEREINTFVMSNEIHIIDIRNDEKIKANYKLQNQVISQNHTL